MERICKVCGSDQIDELGWKHRHYYDVYRSLDILLIQCKRCGRRSGYDRDERPKFNNHLLRRAIALDITL